MGLVLIDGGMGTRLGMIRSDAPVHLSNVGSVSIAHGIDRAAHPSASTVLSSPDALEDT